MELHLTREQAWGGICGVALAALLPHVGCLGVFMVAFLGAGAGAALAIKLSYAAGAIVLGGGIAAGVYALSSGQKLSPAARMTAMALAGFALMALVSTFAYDGFKIPPLTPEAFENARALGVSPLEYLNQFCRTRL